MSKLQSNIALLISFLVVFTVAYLPVLQTNYLLFDDYIWSWIDAPQKHNFLLTYKVNTGRFLENYFKYLVYGSLNYFQSLDFARALRFAGIIFLVLYAYVLTIIFKMHRIKTNYAFIGSILICTLPAFQLYVSWLNGIHNIVSALLSAFASLIVIKVGLNENNIKSIYGKIAIFSSVLLLVTAFCLYQPAAMMYFTMAAIPLAMLKVEELKRNWQIPFIKYFSVGFASLSIYFIIVKLIFFVNDIDVHARGNLIALKEIPARISWFIHKPLLHSMNLWSIYWLTEVAVIVGIIIILGFLPEIRQSILPAIRERRLNLLWNYIQRVLLIVIIVPLSYLPSLFVKWTWAPFRTLVSLETTICILFFISLLNINKFLESIPAFSHYYKKMIFPALFFMLTISVIYIAHNNVDKYITKLHFLEVRYTENVIQQYGISRISDTSRVYVTECDSSYKLHPRHWYEFGRPMSNTGLYYMVKLALFNLGMNKEIDIIDIPANAPLPVDNNVLIIECAKLRYFLDQRFGKSSDDIRVP